jgi:hypothetical protein
MGEFSGDYLRHGSYDAAKAGLPTMNLLFADDHVELINGKDLSDAILR